MQSHKTINQSVQKIKIQYDNPQQKLDTFLILCDQHNKIVYQVGKNSNCIQAACICRRQCKQLKKNHIKQKHQYISAKKFIKDLQILKNNFRKFKDQAFKQHVPKFLLKIRTFFNEIQGQIIQRFKQQQNIAGLYFNSNTPGSDIIRDIISQKSSNWQLQKLTCKDIQNFYHATQSLNQIRKKQNQSWQNRINRNLRSYFYQFLAQKDLIPIYQSIDYKQKVSITIQEKDLNRLKKRLDQKLRTNVLRSELQGKIFQKVILKIHDDFGLTKNQKEDLNFLSKYGQTESFYKSLQMFVNKLRPNSIVLAVNLPINKHIFWQKLNSLINKHVGFKDIQILTSRDTQNDYFIRQIKLFQSQVRIKTFDNTDWNLDDNIQLQQNSVKKIQDKQQKKQK